MAPELYKCVYKDVDSAPRLTYGLCRKPYGLVLRACEPPLPPVPAWKSSPLHPISAETGIEMSAVNCSEEVAKLPATSVWSNLIVKPWNHQADAVRFLEVYLSKGKENREKAALVRMPTGSGKTGIMGIISNFFSESHKIKNVVIVAPTEFLTGQISQALNCDFWLRVEKRPRQGPKHCRIMLPSTLKDILTDRGDREEVYVCTTQTLSMLHANAVRSDSDYDRNEEWRESYLQLRDLTDLVLVDEGHREPAKEWAKAVRSFSRPTILFTATPYRNDLRFFSVGSEKKGFRYTFSFQEAVSRRIIRDVAFEEVRKCADSPRAFVDALVDFFDGDFQSRKAAGVEQPKVIIRCEDFPSLEDIKERLKKKLKERPEQVLAVHDRYEKRDETENNFHEVPRGNSATFWVHQFKLTEGLDDADFCLVAFFEPFPNARGLVQQIGRVIRNPKARAKQKAIVFSDPDHGLKEQWNGYLNFEKSKRSVVGPEEIVERFLESLPEWFYAGGRYRQAADFRDVDVPDEVVLNDLLLPRSARVYRVSEDFDRAAFRTLLNEISESLEDRDMIKVRSLFDETDEGVLGALVSWRIVQTEGLSKGGFFNVALVPSVLYLRGRLLFYNGPIGLTQLDNDSLSPLNPNEMEKLFGDDPTISQVSLISCDLGNASIRRRSMGARSLIHTAPGLNDHFHYVSTAVGSYDDDGVRRRRYLGLGSCKVSEAEDELLNIKGFKRWVESLVEQLSKRRVKGSPVFVRYARSVRAPATAKAEDLLLDLVDFFDLYGDQKPDEFFPDTFQATACKVDSDDNFKCQVGTVLITGTVTYSKKRKRFELKSADLNKAFKLNDTDAAGRKQSASAYFTTRGVMRIVTTKYQLYAERHFYEPRIPLWGRGRLGHLELLKGLDELAKTKTEKGADGSFGRDTWQSGSIFHLMDKSKRIYRLGKLKPRVLICEDLGPEFADFIAIDRDARKLVLIHAKQCGSGLSASDFHIINSQVLKNLEFLSPTGSVAPDRGEKWNEQWRWRKDKKGLPRIRFPVAEQKEGPRLFEEIQTLVRGTSTEKEVWIVLGGGFSISELKRQLRRSDPPYNVVQLVYLLQSCNASVSSIGAKLRVFAAP